MMSDPNAIPPKIAPRRPAEEHSQAFAAVDGLIRLIARQLVAELDHQNQDKTKLPWVAALLAAGLATAAALMSIATL